MAHMNRTAKNASNKHVLKDRCFVTKDAHGILEGIVLGVVGYEYALVEFWTFQNHVPRREQRLVATNEISDPTNRWLFFDGDDVDTAPDLVVRALESRIRSVLSSEEWTTEDYLKMCIAMPRQHSVLDLALSSLIGGSEIECDPSIDPKKKIEKLSYRLTRVQ